MTEPCGIQIPEGYVNGSVLKKRGWTTGMTPAHKRRGA
ncbi:Uncharacterised protein [Mycobacteroides abscessus subsp. abscessus]|nr:Uncharacterised protein [Mycobacteroides abscessus subsp. abscessus]SIK91494.1 Uncharacterised protein [Mycobacteroides abscessus subsp. abscessus]SIL99027.1 Uncharacterised protein [Mycobacteroides abscessus subsp. abscessus]SLE80899.1 Uncharacterised protein [Mycobacteroides abscessus subsp. abscessus]